MKLFRRYNTAIFTHIKFFSTLSLFSFLFYSIFCFIFYFIFYTIFYSIFYFFHSIFFSILFSTLFSINSSSVNYFFLKVIFNFSKEFLFLQLKIGKIDIFECLYFFSTLLTKIIVGT